MAFIFIHPIESVLQTIIYACAKYRFLSIVNVFIYKE